MTGLVVFWGALIFLMLLCDQVECRLRAAKSDRWELEVRRELASIRRDLRLIRGDRS